MVSVEASGVESGKGDPSLPSSSIMMLLSDVAAEVCGFVAPRDGEVRSVALPLAVIPPALATVEKDEEEDGSTTGVMAGVMM